MKPELLSGVGNFTSAIAAVKNGADAVYFGIKGYNMRDLGTNFSLIEMKKLVLYLHENNVKGYLALNTVIFENELSKVKKILSKARECGVDAIIASDLGVIKLASDLGLEVHASTQLSTANSLALKTLKSLGVKRVILARELDLKQISSLVKKAKKIGVKVEVFVHGAMCISVSGRCFLSHHLFGKSANRGECIQPCRRHFNLSPKNAYFLDGDKPNYEKKEISISGSTILSAKDMKTIEFLDKIIASGVASLKIEGRTKPSNYIAVVTKSYRDGIDSVINNTFSKKKVTGWNNSLSSVYNRKFSKGFYLKKPTSKDLTDIEGSAQTKRRKQTGIIKKYYSKIGVAEIKLTAPLKINDLIIIEGNTTFLKQKISSIELNHDPITSAKKGQIVAIKVKEKVRKNDVLFIIEDLHSKNSSKIK